ncbi:MAG: class I SAM-dependent methyltransferase [Clostridia bacterium]|nr:class I SAM-dependent methyltransferase [Clostridia bacterium]
MKNKKLYSYFDYVNEPWGRLFYLCAWRQLPELTGKKILDFGSGFGITAEYLSKNNDVTAVELSNDMIEIGGKKNQSFEQIVGSIETLKQFSDENFDCIICHNVFEYVEDRAIILKEFARVLKKDGFISVVKHNKAGRIMQKAVFDYDINAVKTLLNGGKNISRNFGEIKVYEDEELEVEDFKIAKLYGICTFYGLQDNKIKYQKDWLETMLDIELSVSESDEFRGIAFFHHLILRKE